MDQIGETWAMTEGHRQCTATSKSGHRCSRPPIKGGSVCYTHGGCRANVRAKAQQRLLAMVEPAMDALMHALYTGDPCPHCGRQDNMGVVVKAAQIVLDRAGFGPNAMITISDGGDGDSGSSQYFDWIPAERLRLMSQWIYEARDAMRAGNPRPDIIDVDPTEG